MRPTLLLAYEAEESCRDRLIAAGLSQEAAFQISSYLAQSTDIRHDLPLLARACAARDIAFEPVELDRLTETLAGHDPGAALVWTLTDGIAYFRGSAAPALARLGGFAAFGSDDALFALCQDKFRSGAVLRALGLPCPEAGLARNGEWLAPPPASATGWFVKPNRLGAKIGIWPDSHCRSVDEALALSARIFAAYGDDAIVQAYVSGRNVRASFLDLGEGDAADALGVYYVDAGGDFQTMDESLALYGESGRQAEAAGLRREPTLVPVVSLQPQADSAIRGLVARMMRTLGLRDVFSLDLRVEQDGRVHLIEYEVCPGLPCFDFRAYCAARYGVELGEAMAEAASRRFRLMHASD